MRSKVGLLVVGVALIACGGGWAAEAPLRVTYIANAGFLVEVGESKVLVDALFNDQSIQYAHVPSDETLEKMAAAEPPFDNVDLVLVTHHHRDHFEAGLVADFLASSPETILVAPPQAMESLEDVEGLGARVHPSIPTCMASKRSPRPASRSRRTG